MGHQRELGRLLGVTHSSLLDLIKLFTVIIAVDKVARSNRGAQGTEASMGWGIWHTLWIKEQFFINSRGLKPEQGPVNQLQSLACSVRYIMTYQ